MNLHIGTIILLTCLITFTMGAILFVVARSNPPQIKGVKEWAWSCVIQGIAWLLMTGRGQIPDFFSIVVANTLLIAVTTMQFQSILRFKERRHYGYKLFIPSIILFLLLNYFVYFRISGFIFGTVITLVAMTFCFLSGFFLILRQRHPIIFSEWILSSVFILIGIILLLKIGHILIFNSANVYVVSGGQIQGLFFSLICIADILLTFSFALMLNERFKEEILRLAKIDPLTEVYNRAAMEQLYKNELRRAKRYKSPVSLLMLDLDLFKTINDTYGHQAGDKTLKFFVETIRAQLRSTDILSRYGGEEFALLLPDSDFSGAKIAAERLRQNVEKTLIGADGFKFNITVSIGIAQYQFDDDDLENLIHRADIALYQAKQTGRNRVAVFEEQEPLMKKKNVTGKLKLVS